MYISLTIVAKSDNNFVKIKWNQSNLDLNDQTSISGPRPKNGNSLDQQLFTCFRQTNEHVTLFI